MTSVIIQGCESNAKQYEPDSSVSVAFPFFLEFVIGLFTVDLLQFSKFYLSYSHDVKTQQMFSSQRNTDIVMDTVILGIVVVFMNGSVKWSLYCVAMCWIVGC